MADCSTSWWRRNAVKLALASTMSVGLAFGATAAYATEPTVPAETPAVTLLEPAVISETEQVEAIETATVEETVVDDVATVPATDTTDVVTGGATLEGSVITTETTEDVDDTKQPATDVEDQTANGATDGDIATATDPDGGDESDDETKPGAGEEESDPTTDTDEETKPGEGDQSEEEKPGEGEEGDDEKPGEDEGDDEEDPDTPDIPEGKPESGTGWGSDSAGNANYYENGKLVWSVDKNGNRTYYKDGVATNPDCVFFNDPTTGKRYWYEGGEIVASHSFYDPVTNNWYWADADGTIAHGKDAFIPKDSSVDMDRFLNDADYRNANGKWVRFDNNYVMVKGENYYNDHWYYFDTTTSEMVKHFAYVTPTNGGQGKWVFYDEITGQMLYGEQYKTSNKTDNTYHWYYLNDYTGAVTYGWWTIPASGKVVFYDRVLGWMKYGWVDTGDKVVGNNTNWHFFNRYTGECMTQDDRGNAAHDSWLRMYDGTSKTDKYICVDKDNFRTIIFQRVGSDWDVMKVFKCGLGRPEANMGRGTQEGVWYLGENVPSYPVPDDLWRANYDRMENDTTSGVRWRIHYIWDQGFHGTVYTSSIPAEQQLEKYISDGCVRLLEVDAKWLWDNCANGTRVYIWRRY